MNQQHLDILKSGVKVWNSWREAHPEIVPDLSGATLTGLTAQGINFNSTNLSRALLYEARLEKSMFIGANLNKAICAGSNFNESFFSRTRLTGTSFNSASLRSTNFMRSVFQRVDLSHAKLTTADFRLAKLDQVNLEFAKLDRVNFSGTRMVNCLVNGVMATDLETQGIQLQKLIISNHDDPTVTVESLEVVQTIFARLYSLTVDCNSGASPNLVLVFGDFQKERRKILRSIYWELKRRGLSPVLVYLDKPAGRSFFALLHQLALMARFIIGDVSQPDLLPVDFINFIAQFRLPVQLMVQAANDEEGWLTPNLQNCHWFLSPFCYQTVEEGTIGIGEKIINPLEVKFQELQRENSH